MNANITAGARVRVTRVNPFGKVQFVKTGTVEGLSPSGHLFDFRDEDGRMWYLNMDASEVGKIMKGWSQSYEVL
jgi:hypothetical protein